VVRIHESLFTTRTANHPRQTSANRYDIDELNFGRVVHCIEIRTLRLAGPTIGQEPEHRQRDGGGDNSRDETAPGENLR